MGSLKILAVCVQDNDLHTLRALLGKKAAYTLETSDSPAEALTLAAGLKPDTIVLDPEAAGSRWISLAKKLAAAAPPSTTPLLLLFPVAAAETFQLNGLQKLPCSMLTKPVQSELLESQLNILQRLKKTEDRLQKKQAALTKEHQKKTRPLTAKLERYQRITAALTDYIFTVHFEKGRPVEAVHSPGCESVTGYSSEEFINDPSLWLRIMHPEDRQAVREHVSHVLSSTQAPPLEHRIIHRNGDIRWVCNTPIHHCDNRGKMVGYDFLISDVTGQKQAFEEKTVLESQLRQSHKMEAIGTLAGGIAHDFNNILGAIIGYTGMALDDVHENAQEHYNMEQVLKASYRARDLVKQILTFSRQTEYTCKPVMIGPIVRETLKLLRASLPKTIDIKQNITKDDDVVAADPTEIHQILLNLCTNAYHAMRDSGGLLEVTMESLDVDSENAVLYPGISAGPYLKLTVKDTGCGMERIIMDRVFDPFFTTKSPAEGTGMGLSVVHGIVKSYRGAITLESEVDSGSTFHILLPRIKKKAQFIEESEGPLPRGTECIMFVDDEEVLTDMARRLLERLGYHVIAKTGSLEALDEFRKNPNSIDLVITDYTMPEMTGAELSMQMMRIRPDIPIILCTGFSEQITKEKAKLLGIREFVMKPIIVRELAAILRQIFDDTAPS